MRIEDFKREVNDDWTSVSARIVWEENNREPGRIVFEAGGELADHFQCNPNAFLVACAAPAMRYGEKRIAVDGDVCPALHEGLLTALRILRQWYDTSRCVPSIEPSRGFRARQPCNPQRAAQFFSGGVDALATFRRNRLNYPPDHPASVTDCLYVFGMHPYDYSNGHPVPDRVAACHRAIGRLRPLVENAGAGLHVLRTNLTTFFDDMAFYMLEFHSAVLASIGHTLTGRFNSLSIAASDDPGLIKPWGSHPLIDTNYSASDLQIHHDGFHLTRLEKMRVLADWPNCVPLINACWDEKIPEDHLNCGKCAKCLRTMIELFVCDRLQDSTAFPADHVNAGLLRESKIRTASEAHYFRDCLEPLTERNEPELVAAIEDRLDEYERWRAWQREEDWKGRLKQWDRRLFGGKLRNRFRAMRGRRPRSAPIVRA